MSEIPDPCQTSPPVAPQIATAHALGRLIISLSFFDRYYAHIHHRAAGGAFDASKSLIESLPYTAQQIAAVRAALKSPTCNQDFCRAMRPLLSRRMSLNGERNRLMHDTWVVVRDGYSLLPRRPPEGYPDGFAPSAVTAAGLDALTAEVQQMTKRLMDSLFADPA